MLNIGVLKKMSSQEHREYRRLAEMYWQAFDDVYFVSNRILVIPNNTLEELELIKNNAYRNMQAFEELMRKLYPLVTN